MTSRDVIRLKILGIPGLEGTTGDGALVLSQPKRLTLLAYLAIRGGWVRRDALVELFWPDHDAAAGRRALSQALHFLRRSLGRDTIRGRGVEEVRLSREAVECDVEQFREAVGRRHWQDGLDLYRGELLQGVVIEPSPAFSHWLDGERSQLQQLAGEAAAKQATLCFEAGDARSAVKFQARALEIRPMDEATLREYLMLLDEAGDAAQALAAYDAFRTRLASSFGLEPSKETVRIVEMIRARRPETEAVRPAAIASSAQNRMEDGAGAGAAPSEEDGSGRPGSRAIVDWSRDGGRKPISLAPRRRSSRAVEVAAIAFISLLVSSQPLTTGAASGHEPGYDFLPPNHVAILYFDINGDTTEIASVADYISETVMDRLSRIDTLNVISHNGVNRFRRKDPPIDTVVNALHVGTVVTGTVRHLDNTTRINVEFTDATGSSMTIPSLEFDGIDATLMADSVAAVITENLRRKIGEDIELGRSRGSSNPEAGRLYADALSTERSFDAYARLGTKPLEDLAYKALERLAKVKDLDRRWIEPVLLSSQLAWSMAFHCVFHRDCKEDAESWLERARQQAEQAVQMDSLNSRALELRGRTRFYSYVFEFVKDPAVLVDAAADLNRAIDADSRNAMALVTYSAILKEQGNLEGAMAGAKMALSADQFLKETPEIIWRWFETSFELGLDGEASRACRQLAESRAESWQIAMCELMLDAWAKDRTPDVHRARLVLNDQIESEEMNARSHVPLVGLLYAAVLARAGQSQDAEKMIADIQERADQAATPIQDEMLVFEAATRVRLGELDQAVNLARKYIAGAPLARRGVTDRRWFRSISDRLRNPVEDGAPRRSASR
jgi:DNA-binding SARP family transcriptional activator/TolB-like protein